MKSQGLDVILMHGGLTQAKREHSLRQFKGGAQFLIATNVAARGIDIKDVSDVINFDVPDDPHTFVHRVGRSARMNADGRSFTVVNRMQENIISDIQDSMNITFERISPDGSAYRDIVLFDKGRHSDRGGRFGGRHEGRGGGFRDSRGGGFRDNRGGGFRDNRGGHGDSRPRGSGFQYVRDSRRRSNRRESGGY